MKKLICFLFIAGCFICLHAQEDTLLQQYKGVYKFPEGSIVTSVEISIENGILVANSSMGTAALEKISKDTFSLPTYNGMVYFTRNAETKVDGIRIVVQDIILEGKKEGAGIVMYRHHELLMDRKLSPVIKVK